MEPAKSICRTIWMSFAIALIAGFGKVNSLIGLSGFVLITDHFVEHDFYAEPFKIILEDYICVAQVLVPSLERFCLISRGLSNAFLNEGGVHFIQKHKKQKFIIFLICIYLVDSWISLGSGGRKYTALAYPVGDSGGQPIVSQRRLKKHGLQRRVVQQMYQ